MATCTPTCFAVAVTVVLLVQSRFEQTLKVPTSPTAGGPRATRGAVKAWIVGGLLRSEHSPIPPSTFPHMLFLLCFAGEAQDPPEADRAHQLMDSNHRHDQGLERDPPRRERPPRHGGEPQRYTSL